MNLPAFIREHRFAVVDCESTGLSVHKDECVQVAVIQVDHGQPALRAACYLRPSCAMNPEAEAAHGITWDTLQHARTFPDLASDILALIGPRIIVGYGAAQFDVPLLRRQFAEQGTRFYPRVLDVLKWERKFGGKGKHNLKAAVERWGVSSLPNHDAFNDCRMTWNVLLQIATRTPLGSMTIDELTTETELTVPAGVTL